MWLSLEKCHSLSAWGTTCAGAGLALLGAHHSFIRSQKFWLCKGAAFLPQPSKNVLQSQIRIDDLTVFCRGAPSYSMDLLFKWCAENCTVLFFETEQQQDTTFLLGARAIYSAFPRAVFRPTVVFLPFETPWKTYIHNVLRV